MLLILLYCSFHVTLSREAFTLTEFIQQLHQEQLALTSSSFVGFLSLKNLEEKGIVDELVKISEDEASDAFLRCLVYTKTITNGKGALPLAGIFVCSRMLFIEQNYDRFPHKQSESIAK